MLAILYILISIITGLIVLTAVMPHWFELGQRDYRDRSLGLPWWSYVLPASYICGTVFFSWTVYIAAYLIMRAAPRTRHPLTGANAAAFSFIIIADAIMLLLLKKRKTVISIPGYEGVRKHPAVYAGWALLSLFLLFFFYRTLYISDGTANVGLSVFSDFAVHIGLERSFSFGNNFPTAYPHYAGSDIRYHFMFQFMCGNLEYLGFGIDHAFNIPSFLGMLSACMLLYVYACKLAGSRAAGVLSVVFMIFRSSPSFFKWLASLKPGENPFKLLAGRTDFWDYTDKENWGLWNLKVYMNQRHLAFAMAAVIFLLIIWTGYIRERGKEKKYEMTYAFAVFTGLFLGAMSFFNGAMVIAALGILFVIALFSDDKPAFLLFAFISVAVMMAVSGFFIKGSAVSPKFQYGFIADRATPAGTVDYLLRLSGILPVLAAVSFAVAKRAERILISAFSVPLIVAFTLSLTPDITVGHKYVMFSFILLGIPVADLLVKLWDKKRVSTSVGTAVLIVLMTATGAAETVILYNVDRQCLEYDNDDPLVAWIRDNTDSQDIFLSGPYSLDRAVMAGAMLYYGWPYYAWSGGYDTGYREDVARQIYACRDNAERNELLDREGIKYIIVDREARDYYEIAEKEIADAYEVVYSEGEGEWKLTVYER